MTHPETALTKSRSMGLIGPRGEFLAASVVRFRDELVTVAIGVGQSGAWRRGDVVELREQRSSDESTSVTGHVYSKYRTFGADHVVIDLSESAARTPAEEETPGEQRRRVRVRPTSSHPVVASMTLGESVVEGKARNVSVDGLGMYVAGRKPEALSIGAAVTLALELPTAASECRFAARIVRQEPMRHGFVYGLHIEHGSGSDDARHQRELLDYVNRRRERSLPFGWENS